MSTESVSAPLPFGDLIPPYQATSLAILAASNGMSAGTQAFLSEPGRAGVFQWDPGDQSSQVTSDPDQALFVAPMAQPDGSSGAWIRVMVSEVAQASWAGVTPSDDGANAAAIQRLLSQPSVSSVKLPSGVIGVEQCIDVPSSKSLVGAGMHRTTLKLSSAWTDQDPNGRNSLVRGVPGSQGVRVADLTIDAGKYASQRTNGICMHEAVDFLVENFVVLNATAYACWATTYETFAPCSGVFRNGRTINSQTHLETTAADGVLFSDIECSDGDGDIPTEAMIHPIAGSRNITYLRITARGACAIGAPIFIVGNSADRIMDGIVIEDCDVEGTAGTTGATIITTAANAQIVGLRIRNTRITAQGIGVIMRKDLGLGCIDFEVNAGIITGTPNSILVDTTQSGRVTQTRLVAVARPGAGLLGPLALDASTKIVLDAVEFDTLGATSVILPNSPNVRVLGQPLIRTPFPLIPMGPGHRLDYVLPADAVADAGGIVIPGWVLNGAGAGSYRFSIEGNYTASVATLGMILRADTFGTRSLTARGEIEATLYGDNMVSDVLAVDGTGVVGAGVDVANQPRGFRARGVYLPAANNGGFAVRAFARGNGIITIKAGSILTIERLA